MEEQPADVMARMLLDSKQQYPCAKRLTSPGGESVAVFYGLCESTEPCEYSVPAADSFGDLVDRAFRAGEDEGTAPPALVYSIEARKAAFTVNRTVRCLHEDCWAELYQQQLNMHVGKTTFSMAERSPGTVFMSSQDGLSAVMHLLICDDGMGCIEDAHKVCTYSTLQQVG
jgi:hypothetical protein